MTALFTIDYFTSLDGNGSARGWPGYWGKEGPELREDRVRTFAQDQVLVFGATTFRQFRKFVVEFDEPYYDVTIQVSGVGEFGGCRSVVEMS